MRVFLVCRLHILTLPTAMLHGRGDLILTIFFSDE